MKNTNRLPFHLRLERGKKVEAELLEEINSHCPIEVDGLTFKAFTSATNTEDIYGKIDAWGIDSKGVKHSVQIKNRESGLDLGLSIIMPYEGDHWFCSNYKAFGDLHEDRDWVNSKNTGYYLIANENEICVARADLIHTGINAILSVLYSRGGFGNTRTFKYDALDGLTLKLVKDKGAGYSVGKHKVICYISLESLTARGAFLAER